MMSLSLQNSTKIALDEKMRGCWAYPHIILVGTKDGKYQNRHRREHWTVCCEEGDPADRGFETELQSSM